MVGLLFVNITAHAISNTPSAVAEVRVRYRQFTQIRCNSKPARAFVTLWEKEILMAQDSSSMAASIRQMVRNYADLFANDFLEANPKNPPPAEPKK